MNYVTLQNGVKMPQLGYGVYQVSKDECKRCVLDALEVGYRHIDTAQSYFKTYTRQCYGRLRHDNSRVSHMVAHCAYGGSEFS